MRSTSAAPIPPRRGIAPPRRAARLGLVLAAAAAGLLCGLSVWLTTASAAGTSGWQWFKADTHVHSALSADALPDLGIVSQNAKAAGLNAVFLTDHNFGSSFEINQQDANNLVFDENYLRWTTATKGTLSASTDALATAPVHSGSESLHLAATSASAGESFIWSKRGPNLRSGDAVITFSVDPTRVDPGSGLYVSASMGGDPSVQTPIGYTTRAGVISRGKSDVFVWYLGTPPPVGFYGGATVKTFNLAGGGACDRPFQLNAWITCTIDLNTALAGLPAADQPVDYDAFTILKIAAVAAAKPDGTAGTANAYFDTYSIHATAPVAPANEFVYRNSIISSYDTSTFHLFPSVELGLHQHANRLNFAITDPSQFVSYTNGIDGILPDQQTGYPAQLNHPGLDGGITDQMAVDSNGEGADLMEVRTQNMIDDWDAVLKKGVQLIGTYSTDDHSASLKAGSPATYIFAPALDFDALMRSLFEGRVYLAQSTTLGRLAFNLDTTSQEPYPARYPLYVSDAATTAALHLAITAGIPSGSKVVWIANGASVATDSPGASYDAVKQIPLSGALTYARVELRNPSGGQIAMSEPIFVSTVTGLPAGMSFHVDGITTASGHDYTKVVTKGITSASWSAGAHTLSLNLANPSGALVELEAKTAGSTPSGLSVAGAPVTQASSLADFQQATGNSWYSSGGVMHVKVLQGSGPTSAVLGFGATSADTQAPTSPAITSAGAVSGSRVDLAWTASTDNVGVAGYTVYRNGAAIASVAGGSLSYSDLTAQPGTTYSYTVDAFDAAGNHSPPSAAASVTTPSSTASVTATPVADAYVNADVPSANHGSITSLRVDASPDTRSYLRFTVSGLSGPVSRATLRVFANTSLSAGYSAFAVADNSWSEGGITYSNAPAFGARLGSSGAAVANAWTSVDVTSAITGNGTYSLGLSTTSSTALSLASRESGANAPQLVVESAGSTPPPDTQAPSVPAGLSATPISATRVDLGWSASTDNTGVTGYRVYREGVALADVGGSATSYSDTTASPSTTYHYTVDAVDAAGNRSAQSAQATATTPAAADTQAPSVPAGLSATPISATRVDLGWIASTDNVGVTGYRLYRDGAALADVGGSVTSYSDTTASPSTTYHYTVDAVDAAGNRSAQSAQAAATTPAASATTITVTPAADAYVNADAPSANHGSITSLRVDASPDTRSYLRFTVSGLSGPVSKATLRVFANTSQNVGYSAFAVADNSWSEGGITYANAPAFGADLGSSGAAAAGTWTSVDVTPLITGNGTYSLGLSTTGSTALSLASRESGANAPQLVIAG